MAETVYLLHFDAPLKHARHYVGFTNDLARRVREHRRGHVCKLMSALKRAGIGFTVARTWAAGREFERTLKRWRMNRRLCPLCAGGKDAK